MPNTDPFSPDLPPRRVGLFSRMRSNFLTGLVVIAPIGLTIWLIWTVVGWIDGFVLPLVPHSWQPDRLIQTYFGLEVDRQINVRGIGVVMFLLFTVFIGWIAKGFIGRSLLRWAESIVERTPVVRSIYGGVKQIAETIFAQTDTNFDKACLIEYPRKGLWTIAFQTGQYQGEIAEKIGQEMVNIYVPTTPNPTSGFFIMLPKSDVIELDMSVDEAFKLIISTGVVEPNK